MWTYDEETYSTGERLSDEEFEQVVSGLEDGQGMINYEGTME